MHPNTKISKLFIHNLGLLCRHTNRWEIVYGHVNQPLPMANLSYPVTYNDTDNGTTANLTIKLQLYKCKKDQHWHKKLDNNLNNDLSMISNSLAGQPLKNIKGLVKRPIQFGDAVFVVLHISKLRANL